MEAENNPNTDSGATNEELAAFFSGAGAEVEFTPTEIKDEDQDAEEAEIDNEAGESGEVEEESEAAEAETEEAAGADETYSLADVAEVLGLNEQDITADDDGNLLFMTKIDGEKSYIPLAELRNGYQRESAFTKKTQALAEERKALEKAKAETLGALSEKNKQADGLLQMFHAELTKDYQKIDWDHLRRTDPAEFAAKRYDFEAKTQQLAQAAQFADQLKAEQKRDSDEKLAAYLKSQREIMLEKNPNWSDEETFKKDMGGLRNFASESYGFTDEDFNHVRDARIIELLKDAKSFRDGKTVAEKRAKPKAVKLQSASKRAAPKGQDKLSKLIKAAKTAKGANKRELETEAISHLLLTGGQ